jgi:isopenicillin N synthase-like dioxygenase
MTVLSSALPVIDLAALDGGSDRPQPFHDELRNAARVSGFFYLVGHGIDPALTAEVFAVSRRFFDLPEREKAAVAMVNSPHFRGYTRNGAEYTRGAADWREQFDINAEREALPSGAGQPAWTRLQGPNQWPAALPELRSLLLRWQQAQTDVAIRLLRAFAVALGQSVDAFDGLIAQTPGEHLKIIRYPGRHETQGEQGVGPHKDSGILTFVAQHERDGLQVETPSGWLDVKLLPGSFVVNIGEVLELASNGFLRGTVHQVVTPPAGTDRLSSAYFLGPRLDAEVPLLALPADIASLATGPASDPLNPLFRDVGRNTLKGRLRSHPDVARRWHADLLASAA